VEEDMEFIDEEEEETECAAFDKSEQHNIIKFAAVSLPSLFFLFWEKGMKSESLIFPSFFFVFWGAGIFLSSPLVFFLHPFFGGGGKKREEGFFPFLFPFLFLERRGTENLIILGRKMK
jgi:hypothetical protein